MHYTAFLHTNWVPIWVTIGLKWVPSHPNSVNTMKTEKRKFSCRWRRRVTAYVVPVAVLTFKAIHSQCIAVVRHKQKS